MSSPPKFSILLVTHQLEEIKHLCSMIKRHFPFFFVAKSEQEAISIITEKQIDVLILGLDTLQENEVFYLHLLSAKKQIDKIIFRKIVLCSKEDLKEAFNLCSKDIFDDYYLIRPLYDPYHLLIRLRFIRRIRAHAIPISDDHPISVSDLCNYFDMITHSQQQLDDLNRESFQQLVNLVSTSMKQMRQAILTQEQVPTDNLHQINEIIETHTNNHLLKDVSTHHRETSEKSQGVISEISDIARIKKSRILHPENPRKIDKESNILILEDDVISRDHIKASMETAGYLPQVSGCATHAINLMHSWKPDIVLIDLTLPDMSPLFVIGTIQQDPDMSHSRIIVLAKSGDKLNVEEAMKMGVHEVMRKPIDPDLLIYKIKYNLEAIKATRS